MANDWSWAVTIKNIVFISDPRVKSPIIPRYQMVKYHHNLIGQAEYKGKTFALGAPDDSFILMASRADARDLVNLGRLLFE
jgi:hypothetical protein